MDTIGALLIRVCKRVSLINFESNRQILNYLVQFFGVKISIQLANLVFIFFGSIYIFLNQIKNL
jgi:hypothetical protein